MIVNIQDDILTLQRRNLLEKLLIDHTTGKNIMWASDQYKEFGPEYERNEPIKSSLITDVNRVVIKTRARKEFEQQSERTRVHAEVFTPSWICNKMNNHIDEVWFGYTDVFNKDGNPTKRVEFEKKDDWKKYIDSRRMEITCGEGPYLVSRYDVATGEYLPISKRIGLLDRKLRVVTENTKTEKQWYDWAKRALQSIYGYEFQGDNLLIARINVLQTFVEYYEEIWNKELSKDKYKTLVEIVSWNLWQMDGLAGTIPYCQAEEKFRQITLFDLWSIEDTAQEEIVTQPKCNIRFWKNKNEVVDYVWNETKEGEDKMKFDFIIGNPPYQEETIGENETFAPPIYHKFMDASFEIADAVELIHPARFLFNAGSTPKQWNNKMLNDPNFKILEYEENCSKIFPSTEIKGGIAISYHDANSEFGPIGTFTANQTLNNILQKVKNDFFSPLSKIVVTRTAYRLTNKMHSDHPEAINQLSNGHAYDMSSNIFDRLPQIFFDSAPSDSFEYIKILGRTNNERTYKFIRKDYVNEPNNLFKYKVFLPGANGNGTLGEVLSQPLIAQPGLGATETFISVGSFENLEDAENLLKYVKTKFTRIMLGVLKATQALTPQKWECVPIQDFTSSSDIDWSKSVKEIDQQLYKKYNLSYEEISFIESTGKEME